MRRRLHESFPRFVVVGAIGFVIDSGLTIALAGAGGLPPAVARVPAFVTAALATYMLNRGWTFAVRDRQGFWAGFVRYLGATSFGAALNYGVFVGVVGVLGTDPLALFAGIVAGSAVGLVFNFAASTLVFRPKA